MVTVACTWLMRSYEGKSNRSWPHRARPMSSVIIYHLLCGPLPHPAKSPNALGTSWKATEWFCTLLKDSPFQELISLQERWSQQNTEPRQAAAERLNSRQKGDYEIHLCDSATNLNSLSHALQSFVDVRSKLELVIVSVLANPSWNMSFLEEEKGVIPKGKENNGERCTGYAVFWQSTD